MLKWVDVIRFSNKGNSTPPKRVEKSADDWKKLLTAEQFQVARLKGTERAFTGEYCEAHEPGLYACICCNTPLFDSRLKFESGTGWPSFTQPVDETVVAYHKDSGYGMVRMEVLCNVCDAHLGHVFPDWTKLTGLQYRIHSASLKFENNKK